MNLGMPEMIFIFLLALVIFGPRKLPELGRQLGKALGEFKKASNEFKSQLETEMLNIELEERARKQPEPGPTILPAERLIEPAATPPAESVPRATLPSATEPDPATPVAAENLSAETLNAHPLTPDTPGHNA
jgi:TatA/E family protein of Tat protein translocase